MKSSEKPLSEKHQMIARLVASGMPKKEVAAAAEVHANTVTRVCKMPAVQELIREMQKTVQRETVTNLVAAFDAAAVEAFEKLCQLMRSAPPAVSFRATESILDRSETAPPKRLKREGDGSGPGGVVIQIGMQKMGQIRAALEDIEDYDTIKLLEGEYAVQDPEIDAKTGETYLIGSRWFSP